MGTSKGSHLITFPVSKEHFIDNGSLSSAYFYGFNRRIDDLSWQIVGAIEINETIKKIL